jgi:hypothetical protein
VERQKQTKWERRRCIDGRKLRKIQGEDRKRATCRLWWHSKTLRKDGRQKGASESTKSTYRHDTIVKYKYSTSLAVQSLQVQLHLFVNASNPRSRPIFTREDKPKSQICTIRTLYTFHSTIQDICARNKYPMRCFSATAVIHNFCLSCVIMHCSPIARMRLIPHSCTSSPVRSHRRPPPEEPRSLHLISLQVTALLFFFPPKLNRCRLTDFSSA